MLTKSETKDLLLKAALSLVDGAEFTEACGGGAVATASGVLQNAEKPGELCGIDVLVTQLMPHTLVEIILDGTFLGEVVCLMGMGFSVAEDGDMVAQVCAAAEKAAALIANEMFAGEPE